MFFVTGWYKGRAEHVLTPSTFTVAQSVIKGRVGAKNKTLKTVIERERNSSARAHTNT